MEARPNDMTAYFQTLEQKRTRLEEEKRTASPQRQAEIQEELLAIDREMVSAIPVSMRTN